MYNDEFEICGSKEHKSEFLNLIAWLTENADFVEKARKETTPKAKGKKAESSKSDSSESSESSEESEKPKKGKVAPKKAAKDESESSESSEKPKGRKTAKKAVKDDSSESSESESSEEKPKGRKAAPKTAPKKAAKDESSESESSESSEDKTPEEKPKGRKAAPKKVTKEPVEDLSESSEKPKESDKSNDDPDADVDDKVADDEATIEMDDDDESSCDEVEPKFVMGYTADKVQKFNAKRTKLLETENDKYLNAKTGFEVSRNEKSELKFQWLEAYKVAVPNDLQSDMQAFIDMITKQ